MKKYSSKKKFYTLKVFGVFLPFITLGLVTITYAFLRIDDLWVGITTNGITSFPQWFSLIIYRALIYIWPALILSLFKFDKRYKWISRFIIFLNWTFFIYLLSNVIIKAFSFDLVLNITIFKNLDNIVLLLGYILTFLSKKKIDFDSTGAIIGI
jgi:hypothetical protein